MATMKEQSQKIRTAGMEEPGKENERQPKGKHGAKEERPNGLETSEPPPADRQGAPTEEITEPPEPTKKDEADMSKPPEAFMDPEDAQRIGGDPEKSEAFAGEREAEAEEGKPEGAVDEEMVGEMGPDKGLSDHLTEAFQDFLEPGRKKKTMKEHSDEIRSAGTEEAPEEEGEEAGGVRQRSGRESPRGAND